MRRTAASMPHFNSRAREGATANVGGLNGIDGISTHAPVRARPAFDDALQVLLLISTHAPVRARRGAWKARFIHETFQLTRP